MATLPTIGWIGAGRMGAAMAGFILAAGYPVLVCSRTAASRQKLVARGAREAANPAECARAADVVFSSIPDDAVLRAIALGPEGVIANVRPGAIFVDTSTVSVEVSAEVAREADKRGVPYLRVPISGNAASALRGEVTALVSGPQSAWDAVKPVVQAFSNAQVYLGAGDEARVMKLVVNALVVNFAQAMAEALALGRKAGLDWNLMLDTLAQSTLASPWLKAKVGVAQAARFHADHDHSPDPQGHRPDAGGGPRQRGADAAHRRDAPAHAGGRGCRLRRRRLHGDYQARRAALRAVDRPIRAASEMTTRRRWQHAPLSHAAGF